MAARRASIAGCFRSAVIIRRLWRLAERWCGFCKCRRCAARRSERRPRDQFSNRRIFVTRSFRFARVVLPFLAALVWAQSFGGRVVGLVTDPTQAVVPRVNVTVVNEGTGALRRMVSDSSGIYVAPELPVGYYTV